MSGSGPLTYAELLVNIRQISVIVDLETPCNSCTAAILSPAGDTITIQHEGRATRLALPGIVAGVVLPKPAIGGTEMSWRLPLAGEPSRPDPDKNESPWPARELGQDTEMICRECDAVIVKKGSIATWKDLPSENWAEMMDFWHCHKPSEHGHAGHSHEEEDPTAVKGYSANAKFAAQPGVGFVDLTTFLLTTKDCPNVELQTPTTTPAHHAPLICHTCKSYIGHHDHPAEGVRLYKWRLKTSTAAPSTASILTAHLHSIMLAQCTSKLVLLPFQPDQPVLHVWVLNPSLCYATPTALPKAAMKIFWKRVGRAEAEELVVKGGVEEVVLHGEAVGEVERELGRSGGVLPGKARRFGEWEVGLLERFGG